jgi:hypothetical protein
MARVNHLINLLCKALRVLSEVHKLSACTVIGVQKEGEVIAYFAAQCFLNALFVGGGIFVAH